MTGRRTEKETTPYSSRSADKFVVRLPDGLRDAMQLRAKKLHISMNSWIVNKLELAAGLDDSIDVDRLAEPVTKSSTWIPTIGQLVKYKDGAYALVDFEFIDGIPHAVLRRNAKTKDDKVVSLSVLSPFVIGL